jgi:hypothetical protein
MSNKQTGYFILSLLFLNTYASEKNYNYVASTIVALIIGKLSYDYFHYHHISSEQTIQYCQSTFTTIQQEVDGYRKLYRNDAQLSNWELKEIIIDKSKDPYPFLEYYTVLQHVSSILKKNYVTVNQQLLDIKRHEKQMHYKNLILQLEVEGKKLKKYIAKTASLITMLKIRIQSCKEYQEDCYYCEKKMGNV